MNLTDEEIKALIRKAQGWTKLKEGPNQYGWKRGDEWHYLHNVPNYPQDLNACASFEATLTDAEQTHYIAHLIAQCGDVARESRNLKFVRLFYQITATARQRCLAYLKIKGLIP